MCVCRLVSWLIGGSRMFGRYDSLCLFSSSPSYSTPSRSCMEERKKTQLGFGPSALNFIHFLKGFNISFAEMKFLAWKITLHISLGRGGHIFPRISNKSIILSFILEHIYNQPLPSLTLRKELK